MTRWPAFLASPRVVMAAATGGLVALASAGTALLVLTGTSAVAPATTALPPLPAERPASASPGVVVVPTPTPQPTPVTRVDPSRAGAFPVLAFVPEAEEPLARPDHPVPPDAGRPALTPTPAPVQAPVPLPALGRDVTGDEDGKKDKKRKQPKPKAQHRPHDDDRHAVEQPAPRANKHAPAKPAAKPASSPGRRDAARGHRVDRFDD